MGQLALHRLPDWSVKPTRIKRAHVMDAGALESGGAGVRFRYARCGWESEWRRYWAKDMRCLRPDGVMSLTEAKRGIPCPNCNGAH